MRDLRGRTCIVTGASRGIGAGIATRLAAEGALVTAVARDATRLDALAAQATADSISPRVCDVGDEAQVESVVADHVSRHDGLDILINNAGIGAFGPLEAVAYDDFLETMRVNAGGTFLFMRAALPVMKSQRDGDIVNISSVVAYKGYPDQSAYGASKHAVMGLTRSVAAEAHEHGVRVRSVSPGGVDTELIQRARPDLDRSGLIRIDDVVDAVLFLLRFSETAVVDNINLRRAGGPPCF